MATMSDAVLALRSRANAGRVFPRAVKLRRVSPIAPIPRQTRLIVFLLLVLHGGVLVHTALRNSETFDEPMYLLASRSYWDRFDFSFNREHPPLSKLLIGIPLKLAGLDLPPDYQTAGATQLRFMYEVNDDPQRTLFLGRIPMILVGLLLGFYVFLFGRLFGGDRVGIVSLVAYMLMPGMTGNTPLAALDLGAAAFGLIAFYHLARARMAPSHGKTLIAGITLGLAQLTKLSNLLMGPVYVVLAVADTIRERSWKPLARLAAMGLVCFSTMFAGYGFEMRTIASVKGHPRYDDDPVARSEGSVFGDPLMRKITSHFGDKPIPMLSFFKAYDYQKREAGGEGHPSYFRGEYNKGDGWRTFYLVTLAVKTPIGMVSLLAMALLLATVWPRTRGADGALLLYPALVFVYFSQAPTQLGLRYALPVLPPLAVLIGRLMSLLPSAIESLETARRRDLAVKIAGFVGCIALPIYLTFAFEERGPATAALFAFAAIPLLAGIALVSFGRRVLGPVIAVLMLASAVEVGRQHPDYLMFFNAYAGGPDHGYKIVSVGDDWGQGASQLAELQRERGWGEIAYDYYGTGKPEIYGLKYHAFNGDKTSGLVAAHAVQLTRERFRPSNTRYSFLDGLEPIARVNSIFVFDVKPK